MKAKLSFLVLLFGVAGCMSPAKKMVGQWDQESKSNNILTNMAVQGGPKGKFTFTADGKFVFETASMRMNPRDPKSAVNQGRKIEGTWTIKDKDLSFSSVMVDGKPAADFRAEEEKEMQDEEAKADAAMSSPDNSQMTPDQQQQLEKLKQDMKGLMDPKALLTAIPTTGSVSDSFFTLTVNCTSGASLEFGKRQSD